MCFMLATGSACFQFFTPLCIIDVGRIGGGLLENKGYEGARNFQRKIILASREIRNERVKESSEFCYGWLAIYVPYTSVATNTARHE